MNHFITLDISKEKIEGAVWRVCARDNPGDKWNPRWKAGKKIWKYIPLECDGKPVGVSVYETFHISRQ